MNKTYMAVAALIFSGVLRAAGEIPNPPAAPAPQAPRVQVEVGPTLQEGIRDGLEGIRARRAAARLPGLFQEEMAAQLIETQKKSLFLAKLFLAGPLTLNYVPSMVEQYVCQRGAKRHRNKAGILATAVVATLQDYLLVPASRDVANASKATLTSTYNVLNTRAQAGQGAFNDDERNAIQQLQRSSDEELEVLRKCRQPKGLAVLLAANFTSELLYRAMCRFVARPLIKKLDSSDDDSLKKWFPKNSSSDASFFSLLGLGQRIIKFGFKAPINKCAYKYIKSMRNENE